MIFAVLLAGLALTSAWKAASRDSGMDAYQFWAVGRELKTPGPASVYSEGDRVRIGARFLDQANRSGQASMIAAAEKRKVLETYSSPFLYTFFRFFSTDDYGRSLRNYQLLLLACMAAGVIAFGRLAQLAWPVTLGAVAVFTAWFMPFASDLRVGNVNAIQLAALAAYLGTVTRPPWRGRDFLGGLILALAVAFKPNLLFVPGALTLHWIMSRRLRKMAEHAAGAAVGVALAVAVSAAAFGSLRCWTDWLSALGSLPGDIISVEIGNFAPSRLAAENLGLDAPLTFTIVAISALAAAIWMRSRTASRRGGGSAAADLGDELVVALGCLLVVLAPRLAWLHYFVLTIPILIFLARPREGATPRASMLRRVFLALAVLGLAIEPAMNVGIPVSARVAGTLVVATSVALFAVGLRELAFPARLPE